MKLKNIWFDFTSILCFLFMLSCAGFAIADYFRGNGGSMTAVLSIAAFFLLFAFMYFRMSLQIGRYQEKTRQRKQFSHEIKKQDR